MKSLFRVIVVLLALGFLKQCEKEPGPNDSVFIPDEAFFNALIEEGIDSSGDGKISYEEASHVTDLKVNSKGISQMTGIEAFMNLDKLWCQDNQLTALDVSKNKLLAILVCDINELTSLNVSNNTKLTRLICWLNQLTNLDVSSNLELEWLGCSGNQLTSLDVSSNTELEQLGCGSNQISSLDISINTALTELIIGNMTTLTEVCVWIEPFPPAGIAIDTTGSPNIYFTTECSN